MESRLDTQQAVYLSAQFDLCGLRLAYTTVAYALHQGPFHGSRTYTEASFHLQLDTFE